MPLEHAKEGTPGFSRNIEELVSAGHDQKQAVAIAFRMAGKSVGDCTMDALLCAADALFARADAFAALDENPNHDPNDGRFTSGAGGVSVEGAITKISASRSGQEISKTALVKELAKVGHDLKSNDPRVVQAVESHNAEHAHEPSKPLSKAEKKAAYEAGLTPEYKAEREAKREAARERDRIETEKQRAYEAVHGTPLERARKSISTAPMMQRFSGSEAAEILKYLDHGEIENADYVGQLATVGAIAGEAQANGWTLRHTSKEGRDETSRYLVHPDGREIRVSDHRVPQTAQRESQREAGFGSKWAGELIVGRDWRTTTPESYMSELNELATQSDDG